MKPVIFLGPSLAVEEARSILDAVYLPPARQADLLTAIHRYRPRVIGLIDGFFSQDLPVWHKEILYAIEQGIQVFGASSMGALRAAELESFGMQGIGWVFQQYSSGVLRDDDEVALAHRPEDLGYEKLSEPLVNIRATLDAAREAGLVGSDEQDRVIAAAKAIYFPSRTVERILREAALANNRTDALARIFAERYVDAKKQDAVRLLETIRDLPEEAPAAELPEPFERTPLFETLYQRDRAVAHEGSEVRLSGILRHAALHHADFEELRFQALNRKLAALFGRVLGLEPEAEQIRQEVRRFRASRGLSTDADFAAWLSRNDLTEAELQDLLREIALCRMVQRWWLSNSVRRDQKCKVVLDQLRLADQYESTALAAARPHSDPDDVDAALLSPADFKALVREHAAHTEFRIAMSIDQWAEEAGFVSLEDLQMELLQARADRGKA